MVCLSAFLVLSALRWSRTDLDHRWLCSGFAVPSSIELSISPSGEQNLHALPRVCIRRESPLPPKLSAWSSQVLLVLLLVLLRAASAAGDVNAPKQRCCRFSLA